MISMRDKICLLTMEAFYQHKVDADPGEVEDFVDAILSVLEEPSDGVCDAGTLERDRGNNGHGIMQAMIRATRNGA